MRRINSLRQDLLTRLAGLRERFFSLPRPFLTAGILLAGLALGGLGYLIHLSKALAYMSDAPEACINCHVMTPQYTTWKHSSHRERASCNDCHVPHTSALAKYLHKARDGARHTTIFTLRLEPQVIRITEFNKRAVIENCVRCHASVNERVTTAETAGGPHVEAHGYGKLCWDCHREVPHGRVHSLSSVPMAKMQLETSTLPPWLSPYNSRSPENEKH